MALWLDDSGSPSVSPDAQADLDAISALKESAAMELKEQGNDFLKKGKKYYKDAVDCYTRAIEQKSMDAVNTSILYANRSHVHLLLGNNRHALTDVQQALQLNAGNIKAYFRGAKAALALESYQDAIEFCSLGLEQEPDNADLLKLRVVAEKKLKDVADRQQQQAADIAQAKVLSSILADRCVTIGKPAFKEHTGGRKPWLDESKLLHWPVLFLYPEFMASDFIEDFCEIDSFSSLLDIVFGSDHGPPAWDTRCEYTRDKIELFYKASKGPSLSQKQVMCYLLEGKDSAVLYKDDEEDSDHDSQTGDGLHKWVRVPEQSSLHDILAKKDHVIPGVAVFYVVSKASKFYGDFLTGKWSNP